MIISLLLVFVVLLSVSATFAADENATAISETDEISETVSTADVSSSDLSESSDDSVIKDTSNVVTKDNFGDYFDKTGTLTSDAEELIFEGDFSGLNISAITIAGENPVKFTGKGATFNNVQFIIMQDEVTIDGFNLLTNESNEHTSLIYLIAAEEFMSDIIISNNNLTFIGPANSEAYAILAGADPLMGSYEISGLQIINNNIVYVGNTDGTAVNNVIRVNGNTDELETSDDILVKGNTFNIQIPSAPVVYDEDTWMATPITEALVFYCCENVTVSDNKIKIKYTNVTGAFDTINVISVYDDYMTTGSDIRITNNNIEGLGHGYIYGIKVAAKGFDVSNNVINFASGDYANGIDIEGPSADGVVSGNNISLVAASEYSSVYGIYAWQTMGDLSNVVYSNNNIDVEGYLACAMEINQPDLIIDSNVMTSKGNFTFGIAASIRPDSSIGIITNNKIKCLGDNVGFFTGDAILKTGSAGISTLGNALIRANDIDSTSVGIVSVEDGEVTLEDNTINVHATNNQDNYAVKVTSVDKFTMTGNNVNFVGSTDGENYTTNGIYVFDTEANISNNKFDITVPAADIVYGPAPTYAETIISEGLVFDYADNLIFENNNVDLGYGDVMGTYDTIRAIDITNSKNVAVSKNNISAVGNTYIYALKIDGENFTVSNNDIVADSGYYTCGIDVESPATGVIDNNRITASSSGTCYPVYAGMKGEGVSANITNNEISGNAYYVVGIEVGGDKILVDNNNIEIEGNHTIGIGTHTKELIVTNNNITSAASNEGNVFVWDNMGTDTTGIKVLTGNATISNNNIKTTGDYAADLRDNNATLTNNYLASKKGAGASAVANATNAVITGSTPELKTVLTAVDFFTVYNAGDVFYVTAVDENGDPIKNATIVLTYGADMLNVTTNNQGVAAFLIDEWPVGDYLVDIKYDGNATYGPKAIKGFISIAPRVSEIVAPTTVNALVTATKNGYVYTLTLKDDRGNGLAKETVTITFNGKTQTLTTDGLGVIKYKLVANKVGTQKLTVKFNSNDNYVASTLTATVKITKEATKLTAAKKTFKAKVKTKKYTVTLKDSKGKAIKKVKVTIKVKGKTYKATTNAKGKAVFKIKNLKKKGTYKAKVTFAGNNLYKKVAKTVKITVKK